VPAHSDRLNKIASALARVQERLDPAHTDETGAIDDGVGERLYRYATLTSVWRSIRPLLARYGLSVVQTCEASEPGELRLTTTLLHTSGQWIAGTTAIPLVARTPQGYGSALTYARRYGLAAMVGVCVDQDDDGALAGRAAAAPREDAEDASDRGVGPVGRDTRWWKVPCDEATASEWEPFMVAYANATRVASANRDDVCRDFGIAGGGLVDHFGSTPLGEIVARARALHRRRPARASSTRDGTAPEPRAA
jgi:hypothetical protein